MRERSNAWLGCKWAGNELGPRRGQVWASGGYDHTVRMWDTRTGREVMQLDHGQVPPGVCPPLRPLLLLRD